MSFGQPRPVSGRKLREATASSLVTLNQHAEVLNRGVLPAIHNLRSRLSMLEDYIELLESRRFVNRVKRVYTWIVSKVRRNADV